MSLTARALVIFLSLFSYFLFLVSPVSAQTYNTPNTESNVPKNLNTWTQSVLLEVVNTLNCQLAGINTSNPSQKCLGTNPATGQIGFVQDGGGLIGLTTNMIAVLYTPPTSTSEYVRFMVSDFGLTKTAYAAEYPQGFGFASISPLARIWSIFRNIVYMLFVLVFIVIGMAIMLRLPIDARTVMSISNQIPKIIIGLVMVTFSFGVAGFLIDIMWISTYVTINVIASADNKLNAQNINNKLYTPPIGFANEVLKDKPLTGTTAPLGTGTEETGILRVAIWGGGSVKDLIWTLFDPATIENELRPANERPPADCTTFVVCGIKKGWESLTIGAMISSVIAAIISHLIGALAVLVFIIALMVALFRVWLALIQAYVYLLLDIVLAPFWILASLFPGSPLTIGAWFRDMLAHLAAFPVVIALMMLGKVFMDAFSNTTASSPIAVPLIGNPGSPGILSALIGIGILLLTPSVIQMMRDVFKAPKFEYSKAIGQGLTAGINPVSSVAGGVWGRAFKVDSHGHAVGSLARTAQRIMPEVIARNLLGIRQIPYQPHVGH